MSALLLFKLLRNRNISSNLGSRGLSLLWSLCLHSMGLFRDCETSRKFVSTSTHSPSPLDTALILSPCLTSQPRHYFMWTLRNSTHYDVIYRFLVTQRIELDIVLLHSMDHEPGLLLLYLHCCCGVGCCMTDGGRPSQPLHSPETELDCLCTGDTCYWPANPK